MNTAPLNAKSFACQQ